MTINEGDIDSIARLANIAIDESSKSETLNALNKTLDFVQQIQTADTQGLSPFFHESETISTLRNDTITEHNQRAEFQSIAPLTENGLYLVPTVIE